MPRVAVFGPHPLLTVAVEARPGGDDVHLHAGGQGVWVARMAAEMGGDPVLCAFADGETGTVLGALLAQLPGDQRLVAGGGRSGCYVVDRRSGDRRLVAHAPAEPPSRHEVDDLLSVTTTAALSADVLVVCNPYPAGALPNDVFEELVADVRAQGVPVVVDLSSPRLDQALRGGPSLVKVNDWELAEFVRGPVDGPRLLAAAADLRAAGAERVMVSRAELPALWLDDDGPAWIAGPPFSHGSREGCGDSMVGAMAAGVARGMPWREAAALGAAAGAANFLRHGLGTGSRAVVEDLLRRVELRPYVAEAA